MHHEKIVAVMKFTEYVKNVRDQLNWCSQNKRSAGTQTYTPLDFMRKLTKNTRHPHSLLCTLVTLVLGNICNSVLHPSPSFLR